MTPQREALRSAKSRDIPRVVFDTNTVLSALLFANGQLAWLRQHWSSGSSAPLISRATVAELTRVLTYPKFRLAQDDRLELLGGYLPYCVSIDQTSRCPVVCRDKKDQMFLDLAHSGPANLLITGDRDLLTLAGQTPFLIETPQAYWQRIYGNQPAT